MATFPNNNGRRDFPPDDFDAQVTEQPNLGVGDECVKFLFDSDQALLLQRISQSTVPVLIQGETGVGKEVLARYIHHGSARGLKPFVKVNCASIPAELIDSELFGYRKGAFTGAFQDKPGRFEQASGSTLLLDEIGEMPLGMQAKLLQVLQDQEFDPLGGRGKVRVDVRILAATHRNLQEWVVQGRFRADLFYRLNVISVRVPALRERRSQILPLAQYLLARHGGAHLLDRLSGELATQLTEYSWPGNVRELENFVRRMVVLPESSNLLGELKEVSSDDFRPAVEAGPEFRGGDDHSGELASGNPRAEKAPRKGPVAEHASSAARDPEEETPFHQIERALQDAQRKLIVQALESTSWNRSKAAAKLGLEYKALLYKINKLGIGR